MRRTAVFMVLIFLPVLAPAQAAPKLYKNDIGLMADVQLLSDFIDARVMGIQYRHQKSSWISWRSSAGYLELSQRNTDVTLFPSSIDTIRRRRIDRVMQGFSVSAGLEMQRQFFKKIYFYAGAELRAGYGNVFTDTQITSTFLGPSPSFPDSTKYVFANSNSRLSRDGRGVVLSATLLLGARIYAGKRVIIGTEFSNPIYYLNTKTGDENKRISEIDASLNHVMQRFYVSYRFR